MLVDLPAAAARGEAPVALVACNSLENVDVGHAVRRGRWRACRFEMRVRTVEGMPAVASMTLPAAAYLGETPRRGRFLCSIVVLGCYCWLRGL